LLTTEFILKDLKFVAFRAIFYSGIILFEEKNFEESAFRENAFGQNTYSHLCVRLKIAVSSRYLQFLRPQIPKLRITRAARKNECLIIFYLSPKHVIKSKSVTRCQRRNAKELTGKTAVPKASRSAEHLLKHIAVLHSLAM
jgi:hypothetical protein